MFQYKSNNTNFTQCSQVLVALFIRSKFALKYMCALLFEREVVYVILKFRILNMYEFLLVAK
jgi:hypothetical protein